MLAPVRELAPLRHPTKTARPKMRAGHCKAKVQQLDTLGIGGRRVLVSRQWSDKTLADHRYDQAAWVRGTLALGLGHTDQDRAAAVDAARQGGSPAPGDVSATTATARNRDGGATWTS